MKIKKIAFYSFLIFAFAFSLFGCKSGDTVKTHEVTFVLDGGQWDNEKKSISVVEGMFIAFEDTLKYANKVPTNTGKTFTGWYKVEKETDIVKEENKVNLETYKVYENLFLKAGWK